MRVKFEKGTKDVSLTEVTAENYIVPRGEERTYHVIQEMRRFDQNTGKRLSKSVLQKYDTKVWPQQRRWLESTGHTITIVHDPTKYVAAAARQQAKREADSKAAERAALKADMKAELMAEIRAELKAAQVKSEVKQEKKTTKKSK